MKKFVVTLIALAIVVGAAPVFAMKKFDGAGSFKRHCAECHGADGKGQTITGKWEKLRDLGSDDVQAQTDQQIGDIIANGKGKMPAYKLTPEELKALVGFIRNLKK